MFLGRKKQNFMLSVLKYNHVKQKIAFQKLKKKKVLTDGPEHKCFLQDTC